MDWGWNGLKWELTCLSSAPYGLKSNIQEMGRGALVQSGSGTSEIDEIIPVARFAAVILPEKMKIPVELANFRYLKGKF